MLLLLLHAPLQGPATAYVPIFGSTGSGTGIGYETSSDAGILRTLIP